MNFSKKLSRPFVFFSLTLLTCCAPPYVYKTMWQDKPVVIDGQTNDWEVPLRFFDEKTKLNYSITNDATNLYICVRATDNDNVTGITRRGLQLWIDTTGKKGKQVGILFPVIQRGDGSEKHKNQNSDDASAQPMPEQTTTVDMGMPDTAKENSKHHEFVQNAKEMRIKGLRNIPDGLVEVPNTYGLSLAVSWNKYNVLAYEASIPLKAFLKNPADSLKTLGITFSFTVMPQRSPNSGGGHGGGMHGGGGGMGGGMGGGGMHGGGGGGSHGGSSNSSDLETESTSAVFRLSTGK